MKAKRIFPTVVRVALIFLAGAWLVLWGISLWQCHNAYLGDDRGTSGVGLNLRLIPGSLEITGVRFISDPGRKAEGLNAGYWEEAWTDRSLIGKRPWVRAGFGLHRWEETGPRKGGPKYTNYYIGIVLPFWLLGALCALWPALYWNPRQIRRRRVAAGLCPICKYDLRATPERCPECGTLTSRVNQPTPATASSRRLPAEEEKSHIAAG